MKLIIGNRAYSSWSMRGWLALKHAGLEFEELVVPLFDEAWEQGARLSLDEAVALALGQAAPDT